MHLLKNSFKSFWEQSNFRINKALDNPGKNIELTAQDFLYRIRAVGTGGGQGGGRSSLPRTLILADTLTLFETEGADYAHYITTCPLRIFRTSYGPEQATFSLFICYALFSITACSVNCVIFKILPLCILWPGWPGPGTWVLPQTLSISHFFRSCCWLVNPQEI